MIRIDKGSEIPTILTTKGQAKKTAHCQEYDSSPSEYISGKKKMKIDEDIYGHETVKSKLKSVQHQKCCFCEGKFGNNAYGDVEHFRPKGGYQQDENEKLQKPGYYWLAYDWDNLFFSCQFCNQQFKKNFFPLTNPTKRALSHHDEITKEDPLLVHPSKEDPEEHVSFRQEIAYGKTEKGRITIQRTGLDRLNEERLEFLKIAKALLDLAKLDPSHLEVKALIQKYKQDSCEFRGMIKANFPELV